MRKEIQVLLIEDNPDDAETIGEYLSESRATAFRLTTVARLAEAVAHVREGKEADVVLLDLELPDADGFEGLERLRAESPQLPIVVLTGLDNQETGVQAVQHGAQDYLVKGEVDGALLARALHYAIQRKQTAEELRQHRDHLAELVEDRTEKLVQRNRAYRVLSAVNQVVVRASSEQGLLDEVCAVLIDDGGYSLAWVGFMDDDEACSIRPVAWVGRADDLFKDLRVSYAADAYGRGPSGTAIRTKQRVVVGDIRSDPSVKPWRERALQQGNVAIVSLPLVAHGEPFGVLSIHSEQLDAFDREELTLLQELADDLAYGVVSLRNRKQRRVAENELRASRARLENILDLAPAGIISADASHRITHFNRAAEEIFGYTAEEVMGQPLHLLLPQGARERHRKHVTSFSREGGTLVKGPERPVELRGRRKNGQEFPAEIGISLRETENGPLLMAVVNDITVRRRAEMALQQSNTRLEVINEIALRISAEVAVEEVVEHVVDRLHDHFPHYRVTYGAVDLCSMAFKVIAFRKPAAMLPLRDGQLDLSAVAPYLQSVEEGQPIVVENVARDNRFAPLPGTPLAPDAQAMVALPFKQTDGLLALLCLDAPQPQRWSQHELTTLREVVDYLRLVLRDAQLRAEREQAQEAVARANRTLLALNKAAEDVQAAETVEGIYEAVGQAVRGLGHQAVVLRLDDDGDYLEIVHNTFAANLLRAVKDRTGYSINGLRYPIRMDRNYEKLLKKGEPVFYTDAVERLATILPKLPRFLLRWVAALVGAEQYISVPLAHDEGVVGVLAVAGQGLTEADVPAMVTFASQAATAIRKAELLSETKRLLSQSQTRARLMKQLMDTVPEGVLLLDRNHRLILANPIGRAYLSSLAEIGDKEPVTSLAGEPLPKLLRATVKGDLWQELHLAEEERTFEVAAQPMGPSAQQEGWVVVLRDVTAERRIQERVQEQDRLAAVGQLAAGIAHDFNNIMGVIALYSQALERDPELPMRAQYLRTINEQANHASNLINQILDFSRASVMDLRPLDLVPVLKEWVKMLERTLPESIAITLEIEPVPFIEADPTRLQQVLMNLALNGRDAMPAGGKLAFSLSHLQLADKDVPPLLELTPGDWICLTVADTGAGIPERNLPHIFEPFFTTKQSEAGTGLGLAQVYGIVKQHGGELEVSSTVGEGTTFTVYLPAAPAARGSASNGPGPAAAVTPDGHTLLVVEDNESTRDALADTLDLAGFDVLQATNGEEALALLREHGERISLVLSDVMMPQMGGFELYQRMQEEQLDVRFVFASGYPWNEDLRERFSTGSIKWMKKPFTIEGLLRIVSEALAPRTSGREQ